MYKIAKPLFLIAETPVHPGSGNDLGYIDNPIQREVHTGYPKIEGSSLKGALRQAFETTIGKPNFSTNVNFNDDTIKIHRVFGLDDDGFSNEKEYPLNEKDKNKKKSEKELLHKLFGENKDFAGAIAFTDARILLFPVKSLKGTFAWVTCPRVLAKFKKELTDICKVSENIPNITLENDNPIVPSSSNLEIKNDNKIQLDEYIYNDVEKQENENADINKLANWFKTNVFLNNGLEIGDITKNLVVVPNDDFADFVRFGTEVTTRIKIDNETGTVKDGALFTVEYLPSEALMYSLAMFAPEFRKDGMKEKDVKDFFTNNKPDYFQLGGDATLGKGIFALNFPNLKDKEEKK